MICRKCGAQWFNEEIPTPKELKCPECGEVVIWRQPHKPEPPLDPDVVVEIIIECFHLDKYRGRPVLYAYSEGRLRYFKRIGYEVFEKKNNILYMKEAEG